MNGRCHQRKMMGRGAEGGCGTDEKPCPIISRVPTTSTTTTTATIPTIEEGISTIDFYTQAKKALGERSPFDSEEALSRVTTLPVGLSLFLSRFSGENSRRKRKKSHHRTGSESGAAAAPVSNIWFETEDYFRQVTLADIEALVPNTQFDSLDPCFSTPLLMVEEGAGFGRPAGRVDVTETEENVGCSGAEPGSEEEQLAAGSGEQQCHQMEIDQASVAAVNYGGVDVFPEKGGEISLFNSWKQEVKIKEGKDESGNLQEEKADPLTKKEDDDLIEKEVLESIGKESVNLIEKEVGISNDSSAGQCRALESSDLMLLLNSAQKLHFLEKPAKKRKLLSSAGGDSKRLVVSPPLREWDDASICHVCCNGNGEHANKILACSSCNVVVHQKCYGVQEVRDGKWLCSLCLYITSLHSKQLGQLKTSSTRDGVNLTDKPCVLCPNDGGALKPVGRDFAGCENSGLLTFAHLFCSLWVPEVYVENTQVMEPIMNVEGIKETRRKLSCYLCRVKHGACIRCSHGTCRTSFHPLCAKEAKNRMEIWGKPGCDNVEFRAFCSKHCVDSSPGNPLPGLLPLNRLCTLKVEQKSRETRPVIMVRSECGDPQTKISIETSGNFCTDGIEKLIDQERAAVSEAGPDAPDEIPAQSLPPKRRIKSNRRILKDNILECSVPKAIEKKGNGILIDEISKEAYAHYENIKDDVSDETCYRDQGYCTREPVVSRTIAHVVELYGCSESNSSPVGSLPRCEVNPPKASTFSSFEVSRLSQPMLDKYFSLVLPENANDGDTGTHNPCLESCELASPADVVSNAVPNIKKGESPCISFIHPFIQKRLMQMQNGVFNRQKNRRSAQDGKRDSVTPSLGENSPGSNCSNGQPLQFISEDIKCTPDIATRQQLVKASMMGILDLSPNDEVEGEIMYFQNRLIDNAVALKRSCEDLIFRVVTNLPHELDSLRKHRWDSVLVNQFLCEVREAKKLGRKEKRNKEAQAVLAAATAAAAASSRMPSFRKETQEEVAVSHPESPLKANTASGRIGSYSQLMPRAKETLSRLAVPKVSPEKHHDNFVLDLPKEHLRLCDICRRSETILNRILVCCNCKVAVHLDCYHILKKPVGSWYCELCEESVLQSRVSRIPTVNSREKASFVAQCCLCGGNGGAFRKSSDGQWIHAFCAEWLMESTFQRGQPNPIEGVEVLLKESNSPVCCLCLRRVGVCTRCSYGHCQSHFHPFCAKNAGLYMIAKTGGRKVQHKAYCEKHSSEKREKAEAQHHGTEGLNSIKQIRVELERVRLLCERIIRREKLKRELVLCSHDILASKRDQVAFSVLFHSSFLTSGVSSGSVTTSLRGDPDDNKSWSEAIQRSDDITVDSAVSSKWHSARRSAHMHIDRKTDDSSASQQPSARRPADRALVSGKTIPQRPSGGFQSSAYDGEKRSKSRKHTETLQKELVMTSDQASMQNQRLPKGFAYVPIGCLTKEKRPESHEAIDPEGYK